MAKFKLGSPRNLSLLILIAILIWLATGFYRVEPDEQGIELLFGKWNQTTTEPGLHYFFPIPIGKVMTPKVENVLIQDSKGKEVFRDEDYKDGEDRQ